MEYAALTVKMGQRFFVLEKVAENKCLETILTTHKQVI